MAEVNGEYPTTIGADATFKGELKFEKGLRVLGRIEGQIKTKGQLHVAEGAKVQADVEAGSIQVDGQVKGNLIAQNRIQLNASSKLEGDLQTARLEVADGAVFVGNCKVGPQTPQADPKSATQEAAKKPAPPANGGAAAKKTAK